MNHNETNGNGISNLSIEQLKERLRNDGLHPEELVKKIGARINELKENDSETVNLVDNPSEGMRDIPKSNEEIKDKWRGLEVELNPDMHPGILFTNTSAINIVDTALEYLFIRYKNIEFDTKDDIGQNELTFNLNVARQVSEWVREQGENKEDWDDALRSKFIDLADKIDESIRDAMEEGKSGLTIINTEGMPYANVIKTIRHGNFHAAEIKINPNVKGLLIEETIEADAVYQKLKGIFGKYYTNNTPGKVYSEIMARIYEGSGESIAINQQEALEFAKRYYTAVAKEYGPEVLDYYNGAHPDVLGVIDNVRNNAKLKEFSTGIDEESGERAGSDLKYSSGGLGTQGGREDQKREYGAGIPATQRVDTGLRGQSQYPDLRIKAHTEPDYGINPPASATDRKLTQTGTDQTPIFIRNGSYYFNSIGNPMVYGDTIKLVMITPVLPGFDVMVMNEVGPSEAAIYDGKKVLLNTYASTVDELREALKQVEYQYPGELRTHFVGRKLDLPLPGRLPDILSKLPDQSHSYSAYTPHNSNANDRPVITLAGQDSRYAKIIWDGEHGNWDVIVTTREEGGDTLEWSAIGLETVTGIKAFLEVNPIDRSLSTFEITSAIAEMLFRHKVDKVMERDQQAGGPSRPMSEIALELVRKEHETATTLGNEPLPLDHVHIEAKIKEGLEAPLKLIVDPYQGVDIDQYVNNAQDALRDVSVATEELLTSEAYKEGRRNIPQDLFAGIEPLQNIIDIGSGNGVAARISLDDRYRYIAELAHETLGLEMDKKFMEKVVVQRQENIESTLLKVLEGIRVTVNAASDGHYKFSEARSIVAETANKALNENEGLLRFFEQSDKVLVMQLALRMIANAGNEQSTYKVADPSAIREAGLRGLQEYYRGVESIMKGEVVDSRRVDELGNKLYEDSRFGASGDVALLSGVHGVATLATGTVNSINGEIQNAEEMKARPPQAAMQIQGIDYINGRYSELTPVDMPWKSDPAALQPIEMKPEDAASKIEFVKFALAENAQVANPVFINPDPLGAVAAVALVQIRNKDEKDVNESFVIMRNGQLRVPTEIIENPDSFARELFQIKKNDIKINDYTAKVSSTADIRIVVNSDLAPIAERITPQIAIEKPSRPYAMAI